LVHAPSSGGYWFLVNRVPPWIAFVLVTAAPVLILVACALPGR
jgi:hypothetical protein